MGIVCERKISRIVYFFQFMRNVREWWKSCTNIKLFDAIPLCATPIFPTKVATAEALQSSMHQCSSYSGHTHLQLLFFRSFEYLTQAYKAVPIWFTLEH